MLFLHGMDVKEGRPKDLHTRRTSFSIFSSGNKGWKLPFYVTILLLSPAGNSMQLISFCWKIRYFSLSPLLSQILYFKERKETKSTFLTKHQKNGTEKIFLSTFSSIGFWQHLPFQFFLVTFLLIHEAALGYSSSNRRSYSNRESHTVFTQQSSKSVCFSHNFEDLCNNAKGGIGGKKQFWVLLLLLS